VKDGRVDLVGELESQYQREAAMRAVRRVKGIRGVSNLIKLKPRAEPVDVKRKIEERREAQRATKGKHHHCQSERRRCDPRRDSAILGRAPEGRADRLVPGVTRVEDQLVVSRLN
jgi:BON domain